MKVLQVNVVWRKGSTGKITADIHGELLRQGVESVVCYGRGESVSEPHVYKTCGELESRVNHAGTLVTGVMYGALGHATRRLISVIEKEQPDIVHLQCINGYFVNIYRLIGWLKAHRVPTVVTLHAEFLYTANCGCALDCEQWRTGCGDCPRLRQETGSLLRDGTAESWRRMKAAFEGFETCRVIGCSRWIAERAKESPILGGLDIGCIHNGIRIDNFHADWSAEEDAALREKYHIPANRRVLLHVTPGFSAVKGGDIFLRLAETLPETHHAVVVGQGGDFGPRVTAIPFTNDQKELAGLYRMADVMVSASRSDNYPTVCLEANCCGTPVVGFAVGGVGETIGAGMGETVPPFDETALRERALFWAEEKQRIPAETVSARRAYCGCCRMAEDYLAVYRQMAEGERRS